MILRRPQRIKDSDKDRVEDVQPTPVIKGYWQEFHINGHEAGLNCATLPLKIRDFDEHKKSICYFVKSKLFLI